MKQILITVSVMVNYIYTPAALILSRFSSKRLACVLLLMIPFLLSQAVRWRYNCAHPEAPLTERDTKFEQAVMDNAFVSFTAVFLLLSLAALMIG